MLHRTIYTTIPTAVQHYRERIKKKKLHIHIDCQKNSPIITLDL